MALNIKSILTKLTSLTKQNKGVVFLIGIFIFLRFINFQSHITFLGDQGRDAIIMKRILTLEHFPAIGAPTSVGMVYLGPFFYYFMAPWLFLFNFSPLGPAFGVAVFSIVFGFLAFLLISKHFHKLTAIFFLFFLSFSASNISLSRFSWNPNLLPIFTFFTLFTFYQLLVVKPTKQKRTQVVFYSLAFGAFFSFSFQLHYLAVLLLPTCLLFFIYQAYRTKLYQPLFFRLLLAILSFVFFSVPLFIFDLRHQFLNLNNLLKMFSEGSAGSTNGYFSRLTETLIGFWQHTWQINLNSFFAIGLFIVLIVVLFRFGQKSKNLFYWLNFSNLLFFILGFSLLQSGRFAHYYTLIYYGFFLNLGFFFSYRYQSCRICKIIVPGLLLIYFVLNLNNFKVIFTKGGHQINHAQKISRLISSQVSQTPYQLASIPVTHTNEQYRYFLELFGKKPLEQNSQEKAKQLFIICFQQKCDVLNDPQWPIAVFESKKVVKIWKLENIKVYKLIHQQKL